MLLVSGWCAVRGYVLVVMMTIIHITTLLRITPTLDKHPLPDHTPTTTSLGALMSPLHRWESLLFITLEFWNFRFYVWNRGRGCAVLMAYGLEMLCPGAGQVWAGGCSMAVVRQSSGQHSNCYKLRLAAAMRLRTHAFSRLWSKQSGRVGISGRKL